MAYPMTSTAIEASIGNAAKAYPTLCQRVQLPFSTNSVAMPARQYSGLLIGKGTAQLGPPGLLATAGMHAREWAQPDACLSFAGKLLHAYKHNVAFVIPAFIDSTGATFGPITVAADRVRAIIENVSFFLLPLANPDGREFSMSAKANGRWWRKTRSPSATPAIPETIGVDPNRNFDIAWDFDVYYSAAAAADAQLAASKQPAMDNYIGPAPFSEAETKNIKWILDKNKVDFFIDLHSYNLKIMYPWSIEINQSADAAKNFRNAAFDHRRDGKLGSAYQEYFPDAAPVHSLTHHKRIAEKMRDAILAATGRNYGVGGIAELLSTATGSSSDYAFSRQFTIAGSRQIHSFAIEFGDDHDHFQPDPVTEYPRIEREVHAALITLLEYIAIWSGAIS
jgi:murein tripeptide amidase MpaA